MYVNYMLTLKKRRGKRKKEKVKQPSGHKVAAMVGFLGFSINWCYNWNLTDHVTLVSSRLVRLSMANSTRSPYNRMAR